MPLVITTWINIEIERGIVLCLCAPAFGIAPPSWNILIFEHFQIIFNVFWGCFTEYWACWPQVILVTRNSSNLSVPVLVSHPLSHGGAVSHHHWSGSASLSIGLWTSASISCGVAFSDRTLGAWALLCIIVCKASSWLARYYLTDARGLWRLSQRIIWLVLENVKVLMGCTHLPGRLAV